MKDIGAAFPVVKVLVFVLMLGGWLHIEQGNSCGDCAHGEKPFRPQRSDAHDSPLHRGTGAFHPTLPSELLYGLIRTVPDFRSGNKAIVLTDGSFSLHIKTMTRPLGTIIERGDKPAAAEVVSQIDLRHLGELELDKSMLDDLRTRLERLAFLPIPLQGTDDARPITANDAFVVKSLREAHASGFLEQLDTVIQAVKRLNPNYVVYHLADVRLDGPTYSPVFGSRRTGLGFVHFSDHKTGLVAPGRQPNPQLKRMFVVDEIPW